MAETPRSYFHREAASVRSAELLNFKLTHPKKQLTTAQKAGIRYEQKVFSHLIDELPLKITFHPAFRFNNGKKYDEYAIPDALHFAADGTINIIEIKLTHTADAWHQLNKFYLPIIQKVYPEKKINCIEICRSYDSTIKLPSSTTIIDVLSVFCASYQPSYGVYIWSER